MSDKKHIDRLFQESFKDFEATPSDAVWENIEAELNQKKKKRRVIPIWWRYAGIAALLLLLLTVGINLFINDDETQKNQIVDTENNSIKSSNDKNEVFHELNKNKEVITNNNSQNKNNLNEVDEAIASTKTENTKDVSKDNIVNQKETLITETSNSQNKNESKINKNLPSNNKQKNINSGLKTKTAIASNVKEEENNTIETTQTKDAEALIDKNKASEILNNSSNNKTGIAQNDSYKDEVKDNFNVEKNKEDNSLTLEEAINKNNDIIEEEKLNRWSIAPNAAPVYFNTLGEGSSIDPQFNSNSKTGDLNMSYGISASYAINKKLSIRSGINRVNLGYNTNNVVVFQSVGLSSSSTLQNVSVGNTSSAADAFSNGSSETISVISGENLTNSRVPSSLATNTSINQDLGYIEVPLEIQYALSNRKFGVNLIGGFSSFFLSDNKIFSEANGGERIFLGEATNINKISYSANFGLGLNYQMSKKIDFNLEPMFKYQINTFNNTSGDFRPFFIGVYTGFAIKF